MYGKNFIKVIPNALSHETCDSLISLFQEYPETVSQGDMVGGYNKEKKTAEIKLGYWLDSYPAWEELYRSTSHQLREALGQYLADFPHLNSGISYKLMDDELKLKRYIKEIGSYGVHVDASPVIPTRTISVVAYLNDVADGGETHFPLQRAMVTPVKGTVAAFPSQWTHPHASIPNVDVDKYAITSFYFAG